MRFLSTLVLLPLFGLTCDPSQGLPDLVNWETPHVHPLAMTLGGSTLLPVNTTDNRLELSCIEDAARVPIGAVPVGLDTVSVRARTNRRHRSMKCA